MLVQGLLLPLGLFACLSLQELAVTHVEPIVLQLGPALDATLNETMLPDDVHDVRKLSLRFRNLLDIFSPVYPNNTGEYGKPGQRKDLWGNIRKHIDEGYTIMGDFQDLAHSKVNYTPQDLDTRLKAVLEWHADWRLYNHTRNYTGFSRFAPLESTSTFRHADESEFFWALPNASRPLNSTGPGLDTVRALVRAQIAHIASASAAIVALPSILPVHAHDEFHDFRKSMRAVNDEASEFGSDRVGIFQQNATGVAEGLALLSKLYDKYGDLNDEWNRYAYFKEKKDHTDERQAAASVNASWSQLQDYQRSAGLSHLLADLAAGMTTAC